MSEPPVLDSMNSPDSEPRPVLGPAGNKARSVVELRKPVSKPKTKVEKTNEISCGGGGIGAKGKKAPSAAVTPSILRHRDQKLLNSNLSMNASCSSDASSDSSHSRLSSGKISRRVVTPTTASVRRKECGSRNARLENVAITESDCSSEASGDAPLGRKRCAWVTPQTDPFYATFHDEEWGVPVHDDKKLFELLSLSTALAELTWPTILNKRDLFREVFHNFDPVIVSKLNEKKIVAPGSLASSLLSEVKLRGFIENGRQMCKVIEEFGSFDKYIWGFVNHKPTVSQFRYPRQVPIKTSKAEVISKDLVRRGFRGVGPTVIYSLMQVAGITNDHLISCFRFQECIVAGDTKNKAGDKNANNEEELLEKANGLGLARVIDDLSLSTE